jgi:hypothetical protein
VDHVVQPQVNCSETPANNDRREQGRFCCLARHPVRFLVQPSFQFGTGCLKDLSATSICVDYESALEPGSTLVVQLPGRRKGSSLTRVARVVRSTPAESGRWLIACQLTYRLSDEEMGTLLSAPAPADPPPDGKSDH